MKKILFVLTLLFFATHSFASHYLGGNISWQKTSTGQFIFELRIFKNCSPNSATYVSNIVHGPFGTFSTTLDTVIDISPSCTGIGYIDCSVAQYGTGAVALHIFKSAPITLTGTPPASGWVFYWEDSARPLYMNTNSPGLYFESRMYPGYSSSSPSFIEKEVQILTNTNNTYKVSATKAEADDSLHYKFVHALQSSNLPVAYLSGYSSTSPFPSNLTNAANGPVSIDGATGLISYDIQSASTGFYVLAVAVEQWHNGVLISEITKDLAVLYNDSTTNASPLVSIDTSLYKNIVQTGPFSYKTFVDVGDTINFNMSGQDNNINSSNSNLQQISFDANGSALSTSWGGLGAYTHMPSITPVAPQSGFVSTMANNVNFYWNIANEHYNIYNNSHFFTFTFKDDQCPYPGAASITLQVVVRKKLDILSDTVNICAGDSVQLNGYSRNGLYSWSPTAGLSNSSISNPKASPATSGYYYLSDGSASNDIDSIYVDVNQPATFTLAQNASLIALTDSNPATNKMWYYNGIPFYYSYDTLPLLGYGDYWVKGVVGSCTVFSDTVNVNSGTSFSVSDPSMGGYYGANLPITGSQGITFSLNQSVNLRSVSIPGLKDLYAKKSSGYDLNLKIYDSNQTQVYSTTVTLQHPMEGLVNIPVGYGLSANTDYTIAISGDTAYTFSMLENVNYPIMPFHNGITVKGSYEGSFKQFPAQQSNYLLPFALNTDVQVVSIDENELPNFKIYPNPTIHCFTIAGLKGKSEIQILDLNGKLISRYRTQESSLVIEKNHMASGIYFVKISSDNTTSLQKVIFE